MKRSSFLIIIFLFLSVFFTSCSPRPSIDISSNPSTKVWMHYMPWFQTPYSLGGNNWGYHWKMNNKNPNYIDPKTGKRQIASHYYPLIGPYDSRDPYVIEYHLLLMKYSGIDGVLIDWYGTRDVYDYKANLVNSNALIDQTSDFNLKFGIVYEDWTVEAFTSDLNARIDLAKADMAYINTNYYNQSNYIKINDKTIFLIFGPRTFNNASDWTGIMSDTMNKPLILPLMYRKNDVGSDSEFSWVDPNYNFYLSNFYNRSLNVAIGSAFPGFNDFYSEGNAGSGYATIDHYGGTKDPRKVFADTLNLAAQTGAEYLQIVTWNDFGEGTMVEPTYEFQFTYLQCLQKFTGVSYGLEELRTIFKLYKARKQYADNTDVQTELNNCAYYLKNGDFNQAKNILDDIDVSMSPLSD